MHAERNKKITKNRIDTRCGNGNEDTIENTIFAILFIENNKNLGHNHLLPRKTVRWHLASMFACQFCAQFRVMNRFNNFCHSFVRGAVDFYTLFSACIFGSRISGVGSFHCDFGWKLYLTSMNLFSFIRFLFTIPHSAIFIFFSFAAALSTFLEFLFLFSPAAVVVRIVFCSSALHFDEALRFIISKFSAFFFFFASLTDGITEVQRGHAQHQSFERITTTAPIYTIIRVSSSSVSYEHRAY